MIDLRSDTLTKPTPAMLEAMMRAEVGDDVWNEDPTVQALEAKLAATLGQSHGVFCPSGTMANQIAIAVHAGPGDEVICSADAHVYNYEGGGIAANAGASVKLLAGARGMFTAAAVEAAIHGDDPHYPTSALVCVEDTANRGGGAIWSTSELDAIADLCTARGLPLHLDGARVFNRLVAAGDDPAAYGRRFDSISVCLSKGLGAPVGSVLLGDEAFCAKARRVRKRFGGGMRQAGYLAAAGVFALDHHVERLADDHLRAASLAEALRGNDAVAEVLPVETNIVIFRPKAKVPQVLAALKADGVLAAPMGDGVRFVTHLDFDDADLESTVAAIQRLTS
ncbi:MAG: GntG family PLP-dependent aldolase [Deltaproteobacteria bacterium]